MIDYIFSKKAKIKFIFADYGYGKINLKRVKKIKSFQDITRIDSIK